MINLADLIIRVDGHKPTREEASANYNNAMVAVENIISGLKAVGKLMYYTGVGDIELHTDESLQDNFMCLGKLIETNVIFLEKIIEVESAAGTQLQLIMERER